MLFLSAGLLALAGSAVAAPADDINNEKRGYTPYAPVKGACPATNLTRPNKGLHPAEAAWVAGRKPVVREALKKWLAKQSPDFAALPDNGYPTLGYVNGGGGFRGFLLSAGIHKAFDGNEKTQYGTSGLYQAFTYESGLSGSSLNMATHAYNNYPTVSALQDAWIAAINSGANKPNGGSFMTTLNIQNEVFSKMTAGYSTTLVDIWARDLSWIAFPGLPNGGIAVKSSDLPNIPNYKNFQGPLPIITALGVERSQDACGLTPLNATQYETTPYEFGSWESDIGNFVDIKYLGTDMSDGRATGRCTTGFENLGWTMGVSTNTFNQDCGNRKNTLNGFLGPDSIPGFKAIGRQILGDANRNNYGIVPNPFRNMASAPIVRGMPDLILVDGGESIQVPPIWPFIYRPDVDVLVVSDNSADNPRNYNGAGGSLPSGIQIFNTFLQAGENGIQNRMPYIPPPDEFMDRNLNKNPMTFFGCLQPPDAPAMLIIYLPNRPVVFDSNQNAGRIQYDPASSLGMLRNGEAIATNNFTTGPTSQAPCMACAIMKKRTALAGKALPAYCEQCFKQHCWNWPTS